MKLATTTGDFNGYTSDLFKTVDYIKESGFLFIDYSFGRDYKTKTGTFSNDWKEYVQEFNEYCLKSNVKLVQAHSPMGTPLADGSDEFINDTKRCIEACGEMGIENIVVHSGYLKDISYKDAINKNKEFYEKLLPVAEKHNVSILTENFNKMTMKDVFWIDNATDLLELVEKVNHPLFHVCWDTGHANMQEMPQEDEITLLGSHVKALHVHDNNGASDQHICPFFGTLDMGSVVRGLKQIGYNGYFTFETSNFFINSSLSNSEFKLDIELKLETEKLLYKIGEKILENYF